MLAEERALLAQLLERAVEVDGVVGQFPPGLAGVAEEGAEAAVDVDAGVALGGAGRGGEGVELVLAGHESEGERLEGGGALVEGQLRECRSANLAGVGHHLAEVESGRGDARHLGAVDRAQQRRSLVRRGVPASGGVAFQ